MQRNKRSFLNAIAATLLTLFNGLFGMILVKFVLTYFGSDFNGLNSTASQIVIILLLLEGGFTIATNVALFKPYAQNDCESVNGIISATKIIFRKIGIASLALGLVIAIIYSFVINTQLPRVLVFAVFFMTILPTCFNFYYATKYRILLQAEQKEYVISFITLLTTGLGYIINIVVIPLGCGMWFVRFITMVFAIINSLLIGIYVKRKFSDVDYNSPPLFKAIKGTRDVFAQKLTGVFYAISPIVCITLTTGGTMLASVYAVYNSVFALLKGVLYAFIDAPRLGLGDLAAQGDKKKLWDIYDQYETTIGVALFAFLATAGAMIMPFIKIYTNGIKDVDYIQPYFALILVFICYFEILHIPSGHLMNMTGNFKKSKYFQIIATIILLIGFILTFIFKWSIIGILLAVLVTAISLCILEVSYIHKFYFTKRLAHFVKINMVFFLVGIALVVLELKIMPQASNYISFFIISAFIFIINLLVAGLISLTINKDCTKKMLNRLFSFLIKK